MCHSNSFYFGTSAIFKGKKNFFFTKKSGQLKQMSIFFYLIKFNLQRLTSCAIYGVFNTHMLNFQNNLVSNILI